MAGLTSEELIEALGLILTAATSKTPGFEPSFLDILQSYDALLSAADVSDDGTIYKALLSLSLLPDATWKAKLASFSQVRIACGSSMFACAHCAAVGRRHSSWHKKLDLFGSVHEG